MRHKAMPSGDGVATREPEPDAGPGCAWTARLARDLHRHHPASTTRLPRLTSGGGAECRACTRPVSLVTGGPVSLMPSPADPGPSRPGAAGTGVPCPRWPGADPSSYGRPRDESVCLEFTTAWRSAVIAILPVFRALGTATRPVSLDCTPPNRSPGREFAAYATRWRRTPRSRCLGPGTPHPARGTRSRDGSAVARVQLRSSWGSPPRRLPAAVPGLQRSKPARSVRRDSRLAARATPAVPRPSLHVGCRTGRPRAAHNPTRTGGGPKPDGPPGRG